VTSTTPAAGTSYALGSNIAVSITFDQAVDSASVTLGGEVATLTDSDSDLTYDGSITVTGGNNLVFTYTKDSESFNESISINIDTLLNLTLNLDDQYHKSDLMKINGSLTDSNGNPISNGLININLTSGDWVYKLTARTNSTGFYETDYLISFANPDGDWTVSAVGSDDYSNSGNSSTITTVSIPEEQLYNIRFYSPISGGKYVRGQKVTVTIEVTKGGQGVSGANVTALSPSGQLLNFSEQASGLYTTEYDIPLNEPAGTWSISTQAVKLIDGAMEAGGDFLNVKIEPLTLIIDLLSPGGNLFNIGSLIDFRLKASYPSGEPLEEGTVKLELANKSFIFIPEGEGVYSTSLDILEELIGTWDSLISASDLSGNSGLLIKVLKFEIPPWYIEYFYYILISVVVIGFFTARMTYSRVSEGMKVKSLDNYKEEIGRINDMKALVEREYFHKKIDEETYLNLMRRYEAEMIDINSKVGILETKIKKKIKKKKEEEKKAETVKEEHKEKIEKETKKIKEEKKKIKEETKEIKKEEKVVKKAKKAQESDEDELREIQELMQGVQDEVKKIEEKKKKGKK